MPYIEIFLCGAGAWFAACLFTSLPARESAGNAVSAGAVCAMLAFLLSLLEFHLDLAPFFFLPLTTVLPIQKQRDIGIRLMALLPALGAYALLSLLGCQVHALTSGYEGIILVFLFVAAFSAAAYLMRNQFPPDDWREYFNESDQAHISFRRLHIWLILSIMAVLETALRYTSWIPDTLYQAVTLLAVGTALYWGALYTVCLVIICRREKLTTLIDQDYHNEMQSFMSVIRSQRHDYNFHVQALSGLLDAGNIDECRDYLHNLVQDSQVMNTILPVQDPAIAALIFSFRTMALEYGIELHLDIQNDLSNVVTSVYETNKVIGNLLQNAIDEVRTHKDKSFGIHLYILKRGENCVIHAANKISIQEDTPSYLQEMYRPGHSTKTGHEGIGLSSIQNMLGRYRGVVYSRIDGDIIHSVAKIPLRIEGGET